MGKVWFSVRVVYDKVQPNGSRKKEKEVYLVDAMSFTEAERRVTQELKPYISGSYKTTAMKLENVREIFNSNMEDGRWYKANVAFISLNEKTYKAKKTTHVMLVFADSTDNALKRLHEGLKGTMADYEVKQIMQTSYKDLLLYDLENVTDETR